MIYERKVKGVIHKAYDTEKEFKQDHPNTPIVSDWRLAKEGEWCHSDDSKIVQIIKRDYMPNKVGVKYDYIRTVIGMVSVNKKNKLFGTVKDDIYRFSKSGLYKNIQKTPLTDKRKRFAKYIAYGMGAKEAYKKAYPDTTSDSYAEVRSSLLLKNKIVRKRVDKEIENLMSEVGITKRYLLENTKGIVDKDDTRDNDKLRAIETLMKISGMLSNDKKVDSVALIQEFTGFTREKLKAFEQGMLPEAQKKLTDG